MTRKHKPQNEQCLSLSPNPTNTHSPEHRLRSEGHDRGLGSTQGRDTLATFVRNSKGCEDTHEPVRDDWHCWGVRSKRNNCPKNPRHLCRSEQRQESRSLLSVLGNSLQRPAGSLCVWFVLKSCGISRTGGCTTFMIMFEEFCALGQCWTLVSRQSNRQHPNSLRLWSTWTQYLSLNFFPTDSSTTAGTDNSLTPPVSRLSGGISMSSFLTRSK